MSVQIEWFLEELRGDKLIARLNYTGSGQRTTAIGRFYTYFNHPGGPVAAEFRYYEGQRGSAGLPPLEIYYFPLDCDEWDAHVGHILSDWLPPWKAERTTVFTLQPGDLPTYHPAWPMNVVHSLAMAEGMARALRTQSYAQELADILVRRLHGLTSAEMTEMLVNPMVRELIEGAAKEKRKLQEGRKTPDPTIEEEGDSTDK